MGERAADHRATRSPSPSRRPRRSAQLASFTPEIALLDVALPDMNGRELGARLRQHDAAIKLIAVTGYGQPSDSEASRRAGFAAHLVKPVDVSELAAVLDS